MYCTLGVGLLDNRRRCEWSCRKLVDGRAIEDGSARWTTQGLTGCRINVIESERVGLRKWFTDAAT